MWTTDFHASHQNGAGPRSSGSILAIICSQAPVNKHPPEAAPSWRLGKSDIQPRGKYGLSSQGRSNSLRHDRLQALGLGSDNHAARPDEVAVPLILFLVVADLRAPRGSTRPCRCSPGGFRRMPYATSHQKQPCVRTFRPSLHMWCSFNSRLRVKIS